MIYKFESCIVHRRNRVERCRFFLFFVEIGLFYSKKFANQETLKKRQSCRNYGIFRNHHFFGFFTFIK